MPKLEKEVIRNENIINLREARGETRIDAFQRLHEEMMADPDFARQKKQGDLKLLRAIKKEKLPPKLRVVKNNK